MTAATIGRPSEAASFAEDDLAVRPHLSASQLASFGDCGEKFRLERIDVEPAVETPAWWSIGGTAVHETYQAVVLEGLKSNPDAAEHIFRRELRRGEGLALEVEPDETLWRRGGRVSKAWPDKENRDWWLDKGVEMARRFATLYDTPFLPGRVVTVDGNALIETRFLIRIGEDDVLGYIDAVVEMPDGSIVPRDYKSGKKPKGILQLATYAEAMDHLWGIRPKSGQYLMTRQMALVEAPLGKLSGDALARAYDTLSRAKAHGVYLPNTSSGFCSSCGVRARCIYVLDGADDE